MGRPRQVSDQEILEAARECLLEEGPGVSTTAIAARCGLSQAALFKRFGTKQELIIQALGPPLVIPWVERLKSGHDDRPIPDQLREIGLDVLAYFIDVVPCMSTLRACGVDLREVIAREPVPKPVQAQLAFAHWIEGAIRAGRVRSVPPRGAALTFLGALHTLAFSSHVTNTPPADLPQAVDDVIATIWAGLAPEKQP